MTRLPERDQLGKTDRRIKWRPSNTLIAIVSI